MLDESIFQEVINAWKQSDRLFSPKISPDKPPKFLPVKMAGGSELPVMAPEIEDVRVILEKLFLISLKREEDRPIKVSIALLDESIFEKEESYIEPSGILIRLRARLPFSIESVIKLAPAFDYASTSLALTPVDRKRGRYEIWGILFYGQPTAWLDFSRRFSKHSSRRSDKFLTVTVISTGSLLLSRGNLIIARFLEGELRKTALSTPVPTILGQHINEIIKTHSEQEEFGHEYLWLYDACLIKLLSEASRRGHGGTIVWLPSDTPSECREMIYEKYAFANMENFLRFADRKEAETTRELLNGLCSFRAEEREGYSSLLGEEDRSRKNQILVSLAGVQKIISSIKESITSRIELIAQVSCIDGATVINDELELVSFGSVLRAPTWSGTTKTFSRAADGHLEEMDVSKLGTRHNSAISFAAACPKSIVFVISQDGPVRGFIRSDENTVFCMNDVNLSSFMEEYFL
jgi:hypothetical protein